MGRDGQGEGRGGNPPCCEFVVSVICCLGLVLLANGLCFGKQQNLLPLLPCTAPPSLLPAPVLCPQAKLTLATRRLWPLERFIAVVTQHRNKWHKSGAVQLPAGTPWRRQGGRTWRKKSIKQGVSNFIICQHTHTHTHTPPLPYLKFNFQFPIEFCILGKSALWFDFDVPLPLTLPPSLSLSTLFDMI